MVWSCGIGEAEVLRVFGGGGETVVGLGGNSERRVSDLAAAILWMLERLDFTWITLAALLAYRHAAARGGMRHARLGAALLIGLALGLGLLFTHSQFAYPSRDFTFTGRMGPRAFGISAGWLLVVLVLGLGLRDAVLRLRPRCGHAPLAAWTGGGMVLALLLLVAPVADTRAWVVQPPMVMRLPFEGLYGGVLTLLSVLALPWFWREPILPAALPGRITPAWQVLAVVLAVFVAGVIGMWVG